MNCFTSLYPHRELTEDRPKVKCWTPFFGYPRAVTHIYIHGAEGLENQDRTGGQRTRPYKKTTNHHEKSSFYQFSEMNLHLSSCRCRPLCHHLLWGPFSTIHHQERYFGTRVCNKWCFLQEETQKANNCGGNMEFLGSWWL